MKALLISAIAAVLACLLVATLAAARIPTISEQFMARSVEFDDTENNTAILRQTFYWDVKNHRTKMTANGNLVGGFLEQIIRCDGPAGRATDGKEGYFIQVAGPDFNHAACQNETIMGEQWGPFWEFPENATYIGKKVPPHSSDTNKEVPCWEYWLDSEKYEFFAEIDSRGKLTPVCEAKVLTFHPGYHLWHVSYFGFEAREPQISDFAPTLPPGVSCVNASSSSPLAALKRERQRRLRHGLPMRGWKH